MPFIIDIQTSFPDHYYHQTELISKIADLWKSKVNNIKRVEAIHENTTVEGRHLALPIDQYFNNLSFDEKNSVFLNIAPILAKQSIQKLLVENDFSLMDIKSLWSNTVTGIAIPSIDARLMNLLPFNTSLKRFPMFGLGCMAGMAGINRVADYLKGHPKEMAIFFSVELCSLTIQTEDCTPANIVSTGLFGDGCAAVLMVGDEHPLKSKAKLRCLDAQSIFFPDTERVMGWDIGATGFKIILSKSVPDITKNELPLPLENFLRKNNSQLSDIASYFAHPGGPKVLLEMERLFDLPHGGLSFSWKSLKHKGNMSSVSVLDIIEQQLREKEEHLVGSKALGIAMGPGFNAEFSLFEWV